MYKHILFATDLSEETGFIVSKVREMRGYTGATISLVHVVEPMPGYSYAYLGIEDIEGQLIEEAREVLAKLGVELGLDVKDQHIEVGPTKLPMKSRRISLSVAVMVDMVCRYCWVQQRMPFCMAQNVMY
jgi:nucleotide-binding universal stress UspA family protein